ncbi:DUF2939 domain-containing protein [Brytella acorum]|uniref:DUF2939 domain-containing protein n=1 Tax=Brytella acorum TaxID=2959299 RepID=A0AA35VF49_9PROT|nr:DUF2939 domain-containing protein [Brytella acorum]MDF3625154.1 DUF2939 domain-containing protein [Brytella acorum]CAI9122054.1 DUF2939 domain-containing protein [Brytella acorum]
MRRIARLPQMSAAGIAVMARALPRALPVPRRHHMAVAAFLVVVVTYALSPFMALWSVNDALLAHNAGALSSHIDWSALNANLKKDTITEILGPPPTNDDLPDFGSAFAADAVSHAIDTRLTPNMILDLAARMMPPSSRSVSWTSLLSSISAHFTGPDRFEARLYSASGKPEGILRMKFEHWRWQITSVTMPKAA